MGDSTLHFDRAAGRGAADCLLDVIGIVARNIRDAAFDDLGSVVFDAEFALACPAAKQGREG